tara:strand:+ start:1662 stop:2039 length:378 start_codon:yes stop_codon:yes gene_type:complete
MYNGWEFFILNPLSNETNEKSQEMYKNEYNRCYRKLLDIICIPNPCEIVGKEFILVLNCTNEEDILNLDSEYEYKFLKSKFLEKKFLKIKKEVDYYYSRYNITVKIFKTDLNYVFKLHRNVINDD